MKKTILNTLGQIALIMIGVYLGFALNNFGENRKMKNQSTIYKEMLKNEITENLASINSVSEYHIKLTKDISKLLKSENLEEQFKDMTFNGFRPGLVSNSAYDTGIQTGIIQEFDLRLVQNLNKLYAFQGKYSRFNENLVNTFLANGFPETESEIKGTLTSSLMSLNDVVIYEQELRRSYNDLLSAL